MPSAPWTAPSPARSYHLLARVSVGSSDIEEPGIGILHVEISRCILNREGY